MLPRSQSDNFANGGRPKKKPAPPRPPQPSQSRLQNSQSFRAGPQAVRGYARSMSVSHADSGGRPAGASDLIDFSTPPGSPPKAAFAPAFNVNRPSSEFMYRVGASIFYIKSPLKNSESDNLANSQQNQPFSPPRPSAQSLLSSPMKGDSAGTVKNPMIIRAYGSGSTSSSNNSNSSGTAIHKRNNNNVNNNNSQQAKTVQSNVPLTWDEPPKPTKPHPPIAPKPTIIRPPASSSSSSSATLSAPVQPPILPVAKNLPTTTTASQNYYDFPPESDDDDDDTGDDSFASPPMPDEPPPPPPPDLEVEQWVEGTTTTSDDNGSQYYEHYPEAPYTGGEGNQPYAIALYDYVSDVQGDLNIQAGDLVYLTKRIDESWMYGMCGGVEGMFPTGYVNVVVPLPEEELEEGHGQVPPVSSTESYPVSSATESYPVSSATESYPASSAEYPASSAEYPASSAEYPASSVTESDSSANHKQHLATALYQFQAETENDLSLEPGDVVSIWGRVNEDWLYGALKRQRGQFPAAFVSPIPSDLPIIPS